ncbi:MAG: transcriptional regulator, TetR family protein [Amycolatopsis sp.]|uniref:TetR/AcrR family transcriptional regulator n=1 Tax=Amycolatopsis sp. TaxID=37632 RepID=UPI00260BF368|nr:TetR/AcrR family transcriptional regulator [Amycolatopsis sp.]MCU1680629.1 transcriptional regulator, TetR family protein [Amycolatopsis sp.]
MTKATRQAGGSAPALSVDKIVEHALELAEREGPGALTMRRLGSRLGVDATAVYRHFRDKDELVLALGDRTIARAHASLVDLGEHDDWRHVLRRIAEANWEQCQAYPAVYSLMFARVTGGPGERSMVELIMSTLAKLGLSQEKTALLYRLFVDTVLSLCGMNATARTLPPDILEKDTTAWSRVYAVLPHEGYPAIRGHADALVSVTGEQIYRASVESTIAYIAAQV